MEQSLRPRVDAERLSQRCVEICQDRKADDLRLYDVRETSLLADYFVICTANSVPHLRAISGRLVRDLGEEEGVQPRAVDGAAGSHWVVLDYGSVLVHVFLAEEREYYNIEALWRGEKPARQG